MTTTKYFVSALIISASMTVGNVAANELILTGETAKSGHQVLALDVFSTGDATGLEIRIAVPDAKGAKVDTSKCASSLPSSHTGGCRFNGHEIVVLVYSLTNAILPEGMLDLGSVSISGASIAKINSSNVSSFIAASPGGVTAASKVFARD